MFSIYFFFVNKEVTDPIPSGLRTALASYYLFKYRGSGISPAQLSPAPVKFDFSYTDMEYVRIHRAASDQEGQPLQHYTEMLVREFRPAVLQIRTSFSNKQQLPFKILYTGIFLL